MRSIKTFGWRSLALLLTSAILNTATLHAATGAIRLEPVLRGLSAPNYVTNAHDGSQRLFVVEQPGRIQVLAPGTTTPSLYLDIASKVLYDEEHGLLGLAYHPQFASNGRFFVDYTRQPDGATVIAEYQASADPATTAATENVLMVIPQPYAGHRSGMIEFGDDGYLYIGTADGGPGDDPENRAQNTNELLGKILRIDVNDVSDVRGYSVPTDNPFAGSSGRNEVYALGFRNPFRFSFDRDTGQLYAGDIGALDLEEIDKVTLGANYGWRVFEGTACTGLDPAPCNPANYAFPLVQYDHSGTRCAVIGGYVYRGTQGTLPSGTYVFGDQCSGEIFSLVNHEPALLFDAKKTIASFGEDESGELYVVGPAGTVDRITRTSVNPPTGTRPIPEATAIDRLNAKGISAAAVRKDDAIFTNGGFETPSVGNGFQYSPNAASWLFVGGGIAGNGSGFTNGNPDAPEGSQVAFLQGGASQISQTASISAGTYTLSLRAAQRGNYQFGTQVIRVQIDGVTVGEYQPPGTSYTAYQTTSFTIGSTGNHTVALLGVGSGGDFTGLVDDVRLTSAVVNATTTTVASSANPSTFGSAVTFTANVSGTNPTGSVNFTDDGNSLSGCSAVALAGSGNTRTATCSVSTLAAGTHSIAATYSGDASNLTSTSSPLSQQINTVTTGSFTNGGFETPSVGNGFQYSPNAASWLFVGGGIAGNGSGFTNGNPDAPEGSQVAFLQGGASQISQTASISAGTYTLSLRAAQRGNYQFGTQVIRVQIDGVTVGEYQPPGTSYTAYQTTSFTIGSTGNHTVALLGVGSGGDFTGLVDDVRLTSAVVNATTTTVASSANPSTFGSAVTFTANVSGTNPTGSVNFTDGGNSLSGCSAVALAGSGNTRTATCSVSTLAAGTHSIAATYSGDASNLTSTSSPLSQQINTVTTGSFTNGGFETPSVGNGFQYSPNAASWLFVGGGIAGNGSGFTNGNPDAPEGSQVAFLQGGASQISQTASISAGTYTLSLRAAQRGNYQFGTQVIRVQIDGVTVGEYQPPGTSYTAYQTTSFTIGSTGNHTVALLGVGSGGDFTGLVDDVRLTSAVVNATTTTVASSANPSTFGSAVTFTANVSGTNPTGSVNFTDDGNSLSGCSAVALAGSGNTRTATCSVSTLAAGTHSIAATYSGDASNLTSTSSPLSQQINTVTTGSFTNGGFETPSVGNGFQYSPNAASWLFVGGGIAGNGSGFTNGNPDAPEGSQVAFLQGGASQISQTASISAGTYTLSLRAAQRGNYQFGTQVIRVQIDGVTVGEYQPPGTSYTAYQTTSFTIGSTGNHTVALLGVGSGGDFTGLVDDVRLTSAVVNATTTTVASSANPSTFGSAVTFTANVSGTNPTGSVNFTDGGNSLSGCSAVALAGSGNTRTATCSVSTLAAGTHSIAATYSGDASNLTSTSSPLSQSIAAANQTISFAALPDRALNSPPFTVSATASSGLAVTVSSLTTAICTVAAPGNTVTLVAIGTCRLRASQAGNANYAAAPNVDQAFTIVAGTGTATTLVTSLNPANIGASVTFTASVSGTNPTGTVNFTDGGSSVNGCGGVALAGSGNTRTATCSVSTLSVGSHSIVATYNGDGGNPGASSDPLNQVVFSNNARLTLSGTVNAGGAPVAGVHFISTGGEFYCPDSDTTGHYFCIVTAGWSGTITPTLQGYEFSPQQRSYDNVVSDDTQDYIGFLN